MPPIAIITVSILAITAGFKIFNRVSPIKICPICAGVSGTWILLLLGINAGKLSPADFLLPTALLIGGSVVGIAYQVENLIPKERSLLVWKSSFIPLGFIASNFLISSRFIEFIIMAGLLLTLMSLFIQAPKQRNRSPDKKVEPGEDKEKRLKKLEAEMEQCC